MHQIDGSGGTEKKLMGTKTSNFKVDQNQCNFRTIATFECHKSIEINAVTPLLAAIFLDKRYILKPLLLSAD